MPFQRANGDVRALAAPHPASILDQGQIGLKQVGRYVIG